MLNSKGDVVHATPFLHRLIGKIRMAAARNTIVNRSNYYRPTREIKAPGVKVSVLLHRQSLLEYVVDLKNHRCLLCGVNLLLHLAHGAGAQCGTIFN